MITFVGKPARTRQNDDPEQKFEDPAVKPIGPSGISSVITKIVEIMDQVPLPGAVVDFFGGLSIRGTGFQVPPLEKFVQHRVIECLAQGAVPIKVQDTSFPKARRLSLIHI